MMRCHIPVVGNRGWVQDSLSHPLPEGLPDRTPVEIVSIANPHVFVRDAAGREWRLIRWQLDCGADYCGPAGNWMHESRPQVLRALKEDADRLEALPPRPTSSGRRAIEEQVRRNRWVIERNTQQ